MRNFQRHTKAEGLARAAEELAAAYDIEPNPIEFGTKWKAQLGILRMPGLSLGVASLMACLIEYADEEMGIAWPSETTIAAWAATSLRSIERAVPRAAKLRLVTVTERDLRGLKRGNIYLINWQPFLDAFNRPRPGRDASVTKFKTPRQSGGSAYRQSGGSDTDKVADDYSYLTTLKETTVVHPSSTAGTPGKILPMGEKRRGKQGEQVEKHSPPPIVPAKPLSPTGFQEDRLKNLWFNVSWWERKVDAETNPERRKELEAKLARAHEQLEEAMKNG
jgi:hypothetical protein